MKGRTPHRKEREQGTKLVDQRITKFLTSNYKGKETENDNPEGNKKKGGSEYYGSGGEAGNGEDKSKINCNELKTDCTSNNKVGGVDSIDGEKKVIIVQQAGIEPAEQCIGRGTELSSLGCEYSSTDSFERRKYGCTEQQRQAGTAD